ncbi:adenylyl-sulfate kinase [Sulfurimonas sp. SAG-AH-194-C21]|nr:adenylyl-sulfate kinase [Sulfurimonas sp. SAG-AH-194-C21]MDF1883733.1 adenylyl-sulfate kinase [Sulfurimonas sp. SAG-AH-194-C21]
MLVWLIGISGAGKTTLGNRLKKYYDKNNIKSFILDGDIVRDFYDNDLGYTKEDRVANIKRIMLSAYVLERNGIIPIICNISPFEELREFARNKFHNYKEIYLKKNIDIAQDNDVKNVYKSNLLKTSIVGIDMKFEEPLHSDLTIEVDLENENESFLKIINFLKV